jgi:DNA-binding NtrC family response regulator
MRQFWKMINLSNSPVGEHEAVLSGTSVQAHAIRQLVELAAQTYQPVQIWGPAGAGHLEIALAIHNRSKSATGRFFDASKQKISTQTFDKWHEGTIYLGDLSRMAFDLRTDLIQWQRDNAGCRVRLISKGGTAVSAMPNLTSHRSTLIVPCSPLVSRAADIPAMLHRLCEETSHGVRPPLSKSAWKILLTYHWPGNFDELRRFADRLMQSSGGTDLSGDDIRQMLDDDVGNNPHSSD